MGHFEEAKAFLTPKLSRALLDPGSEIRDGKKLLLWNRDKHLGSAALILHIIWYLLVSEIGRWFVIGPLEFLIFLLKLPADRFLLTFSFPWMNLWFEIEFATFFCEIRKEVWYLHFTTLFWFSVVIFHLSMCYFYGLTRCFWPHGSQS